MPNAAPDNFRCTVHALFAFDLGLAIDLARAATLLSALNNLTPANSPSAPLPVPRTSPARPTPTYFKFKPTPLRLSINTAPVTIASLNAATTADATFYDFGAVTIAFHISYSGPLAGLLPLAEALYDCRALLEQARRLVNQLLDQARPAIKRPALVERTENYVLYQFDMPEPAHTSGQSSPHPLADPISFIAANTSTLARILRSEARTLSDQEIHDAMCCRISYTPHDAAVIDWNAALLFLDEPIDARSILEFANVELLEMRHLDDQLDDALQASVPTLRPRKGLGAFNALLPGSNTPDLDRVAELQMESSLLFENVNNALKLVGDQYLARLYRLAADRLHLPEWDTAILRKLGTLESIYQKLSGRQSTNRLELLEWIVIILIAVDLVVGLVGHR